MQTVRDTCYRDELARLTPNLRRFARALVRNHNTDVSDELVQTTLLRALAADHARRGARLVIWLNSILTGLYREQVRDIAADKKVRSGSSDAQKVFGGSRWDTRTQRRDPTLLSGIPLEYREALLLVVIENMSYAQAAETLGLSINTLATRVARAREYLAEAQAGWSYGPVVRTAGAKAQRAAPPYLRLVK